MMGMRAKPLSKARTVWAPKEQERDEDLHNSHGAPSASPPCTKLAELCTLQQPTGLEYRDGQLRN